MNEPTEASVRAEVRAWLEANWNPDLGLVEWRNKLADSGWGVPHWPKQWYGRDLPVAFNTVVDEECHRIGDPRTEEGRALLKARSPLHRAGDITKPMLIGHGANDVRCKVAEADQIVAAMQAKDIPVIYVVFPNEGHGFHHPANNIAFNAITEAFLARHLGGPCEAVGDDFAGSSHDIRAGNKLLAGLGIV